MIKVKLIFKFSSIFLCIIYFIGTTNTAAVNQLLNLTGQDSHYIVIENKKIFMMYDIPHLFKNIRNALYQYNILFDQNKTAKWSHIEEAYKIDLTRRFQGTYIFN